MLENDNKRTIIVSPVYCHTDKTYFSITYINSLINMRNWGKVDSENTENYLEPEQAQILMSDIRDVICKYLNTLNMGDVIDILDVKPNNTEVLF